MSAYGSWAIDNGTPVFVYTADQRRMPEATWDPLNAPPTDRHWIMVGNRRIRLYAANDGGVALFDEHSGLRWLTSPDAGGTGVSVLVEDGQPIWGSYADQWPAEHVPQRTFGPTFFRVQLVHDGLELERTILCPEGEAPWVLVRIRLRATGRPRAIEHREEWVVRPRFLNLGGTAVSRAAQAAKLLYSVRPQGQSVRAREDQTVGVEQPADPQMLRLATMLGAPAGGFPQRFGPPVTLLLEALGSTAGSIVATGGAEPSLAIHTSLRLEPDVPQELWYRFGIDDGHALPDPSTRYTMSMQGMTERLPHASAAAAPEAEREIPWHAALLTGGSCADGVIGGHTLDQGSAYAFVMGFNGAARDPLQCALPLVYSEPDLALSVLRNTCAWARPSGELIYGLDGSKQPWTTMWQPSDHALWSLWLAAEYAAATGDLASFDTLLAYHPVYEAPAVPLREHLRRQFRFFCDTVGTGARGHVRIRNADWNDMVIRDVGGDASRMIAEGESVLNSAMAAWVLPVYAGLCQRLGEAELAQEARQRGESLRRLVAASWNGRWFDRAYGPDGQVIGGADDLWLEVQPWALLCGAADDTQRRALLAAVEAGPRAGSPLGARVRWPSAIAGSYTGAPGEGTGGGGIWAAISMTLVWAAAQVDPPLAWDEWRRMTLAAHTAAYPTVWEGTLSGPDSYNAPESQRPGRTWGMPGMGFGMQAFPVSNLNSHAHPLLAYLRLLGVTPMADGSLAVGAGAQWSSQTLQVDADGHGRLMTRGPVTLVTVHGIVRGGPGVVRW